MAYFTGTANTPADLLLKLKSHAESIGWITDRSSANEWCCHNDDGFWSIKAFNNYLNLFGNTGFNSSKAYDKQPGSSGDNKQYQNHKGTRCNLASSPFVAYHLFATEDYLHLVTEIASGQFRPLFIGTLDKRGAVYEGGQYVCGYYQASNRRYYSFDGAINGYQEYPSLIRVDAQDGEPSPYWLPFDRYYVNHTAIGLGNGYLSSSHPSALLVETSANRLTGGTLLIPCTIYTVGAENRTRMIGEVPDFRVCRMDYLSPGDTVIVGSETWRVFPPVERTANDNQGSGMVGYAYKVVA